MAAFIPIRQRRHNSLSLSQEKVHPERDGEIMHTHKAPAHTTRNVGTPNPSGVPSVSLSTAAAALDVVVGGVRGAGATGTSLMCGSA